MTKNEILEINLSKTFPDSFEKGALNAMSDYAKQQAIAFAIHYAETAIQNGYARPSFVGNDRMDVRYEMFIEQQNKP